jgi:hypothetical protein
VARSHDNDETLDTSSNSDLNRRLGLLAAVAIGGTVAISAPSASAHHSRDRIEHVLLISVDGMHQSDLDWYIANHPTSGSSSAKTILVQDGQRGEVHYARQK